MPNVRLLRQYMDDLEKKSQGYFAKHDLYAADVGKMNKMLDDKKGTVATLSNTGQRVVRNPNARQSAPWNEQRVVTQMWSSGDGESKLAKRGFRPMVGGVVKAQTIKDPSKVRVSVLKPEFVVEEKPKTVSITTPKRGILGKVGSNRDTDSDGGPTHYRISQKEAAANRAAAEKKYQTLDQYAKSLGDKLQYGDSVDSRTMGHVKTPGKSDQTSVPVRYYYLGDGRWANYLAAPKAPEAPQGRHNFTQSDIRAMSGTTPTQTEAEVNLAAAKGYAANPMLAAQPSGSSLAMLESLRSAPSQSDTGMSILGKVLRNKL